jgi:hypothetical protein
VVCAISRFPMSLFSVVSCIRVYCEAPIVEVHMAGQQHKEGQAKVRSSGRDVLRFGENSEEEKK